MPAEVSFQNLSNYINPLFFSLMSTPCHFMKSSKVIAHRLSTVKDADLIVP